MTGEAHHRINWSSATITVDGPTGALVGYQGARLVVGALGGEWRARLFDDAGALMLNEVVLASTKDRGKATVTFPDGTVWAVEREGDCGCG